MDSSIRSSIEHGQLHHIALSQVSLFSNRQVQSCNELVFCDKPTPQPVVIFEELQNPNLIFINGESKTIEETLEIRILRYLNFKRNDVISKMLIIKSSDFFVILTISMTKMATIQFPDQWWNLQWSFYSQFNDYFIFLTLLPRGNWWLPAHRVPCTCPGIFLPGKIKCRLHSWAVLRTKWMGIRRSLLSCLFWTEQASDLWIIVDVSMLMFWDLPLEVILLC